MTIADDMQYIDRHRDDPCDEWPMYLIPGVLSDFIAHMIKMIIPDMIGVSGMMKNRTIPQGATFLFASGGTFAPDTGSRRFMPLMGEAGTEAIMPRRSHGKSIYPQALLCIQGEHRWTEWGPYHTVQPHSTPVVMVKDEPPIFTPVEAYRWRHCVCGAAEREKWHTHERKLFNRDETR